MPKSPLIGSLLSFPEEVIFILRHLKENYNVFEYGCGLGTNIFSAYVKQWYAVEHNIEWFEKINNSKNYKTQIFYKPHIDNHKDRFKEDKTTQWDLALNSQYAKRYKNYIQCFSEVKDIDLVIIDGRARTACARYVFENCTNECKIIIHDWNRLWYKRCLNSFYVLDEMNVQSPWRGKPGIVLLKKHLII
jgi:hypothetical protein